MFRRSVTYFSHFLLSLVAAGSLVIHPGTASAAQLTPQQVTQFLANPSALLAANPNGGDALVSTIRDLLLSDHSTLSAIIALLGSATPDQQSAIGSGLGQAAQASDPAFASQIQRLLAESGSPLAIASYQTTTGNVQIGAGGGGGGGGGPTNGGPPTGGGGGGNSATSSTGTGGGGGLTGSSSVQSGGALASAVSPR